MNLNNLNKRGTPHLYFSLLFLGCLIFVSTISIWTNSPAEAVSPLQTDPVIQFTNSNLLQNEPDANLTVNVPVTINPAVTGTTVVTVTYQTVNATAVGGQDFTAIANGVLTFTAASGTSQTIPITILPDTAPEERENFIVVLKNPVNATLGTNSTLVINIEANDIVATNTPTPNSGATATPLFIDAYEGNDTLQTAYSLDTVFPTGCAIDDSTFWPAGDVDFFRFWAQAGIPYTIRTDQVSNGLDTSMTLYNPEGGIITTNAPQGVNTASVEFTPSTDAWHYISLINEDPSNPAGKTYCVRFELTAPTQTPSPTPTFQLVANHDACKVALGLPDNDSPNNACLIELTGSDSTNTVVRNFVPREEGIRDVDYYRIWVRQNNFYECSTVEGISELNDTKMKFLNQDLTLLTENDNADATTAGSTVSYLSTYTGWLYIVVEPMVPIEYRIADKYEYTLACTAQVVTPTSTPQPTVAGGTGGGGFTRPTSTPTATPTQIVQPQETIDVLATVQAASTPTPPPTARPNISINPLPTEVPPMTPVFRTNLQVVLFYDRNQNNLPEIDEGIVDMAVLAKDSATGELLALGYTNEAGLLRFELSPSSQSINIMIPYLNIDQTVSTSSSELLIRVAPSALPNTLP